MAKDHYLLLFLNDSVFDWRVRAGYTLEGLREKEWTFAP